MTNGDRIRAMSDDELMRFIRSVQCCSYYGEDCGYPFCNSMNGHYCYGIEHDIDSDLLGWLRESSYSRKIQTL